MAESKPTLSGRVAPWIREWVEREATRRDRSKSYIFEELLEESIKRRQRQNDRAAKVAA